MSISEIYKGLVSILGNMDSPSLPVRSIDAMTGTVEFTNGIQYSLVTGERIL